MSRGGAALFLFAVVWGWSGSSAAQVSSTADAGAGEVTSLQKQLARDYEALSTGDCTVACQALASMQRVVDRICALDPGPPCTEARARLADAENRVRSACPECAVTAVGAETTSRATGEDRAPAPAPPAESPRSGGCAGCAVSDEDRTSGAALAVACALAAWVRRRRRARGSSDP
jgi:MYXO-CTERM domain-containing protein